MAKTIICIATPLYAPDIGGPATHVALLEHGLSRSEFELRIVKFSDVRGLPKILRHIVYFFKVLAAGRGARFIYALDPTSVGVPAFFAAKLLGKKFLLRVGGDYAWEQGTQRFGVTETLDEFITHRQPRMIVRRLQFVQSYIARRAVCVVAPSEYLAGIIRTWGVAAYRIKVVYSQPELAVSNLSKSDARKKLKLHEDEEIIFSSGRLVPWKGFEGLVDATARVRNDRPARLYIAGEGPYRESLVQHIQTKDAQNFVTLLGQLSQDELAVWLAAADMFVLNTAYEGLSHALLEAFAAHTPVITTPVGGNTELVDDESTGLLVEHNNIRKLSAAIMHLLTDRVFAEKIASQAYASLSRFNKDAALQSLSSLFKSL